MSKRFCLVLTALVVLSACEEEQQPTASTASATAPKPTLAPTPSAEPPKEAKKPRPKKSAADCPKGPAVVFDDKAVEAEVRKKLAKADGTITIADLGKLKSLNLSQVEMHQLDPCIIPHAKNLKELFLGPGDLDDLSLLSGMTQLESLRASISKVNDLTPLEKLVKLDRIDLGRTQVTDIMPLKGLKNLTELALDDTQVRDLRALESHKKLERLSIQRTLVKDYSPLKDIKTLKFLYVAGTPPSDLSVIQPLRDKGLKVIDQ